MTDLSAIQKELNELIEFEAECERVKQKKLQSIIKKLGLGNKPSPASKKGLSQEEIARALAKRTRLIKKQSTTS